MRPVLFHIGSFPVYSYSVFVALAYLAGLGYALLEARRLKLDPVHVVDASLWLFVFAIVGARVMFMIVDYRRFIDDPREIYRIWNGGLVFYGGFIASVLAGVVYIKRHQLPLALWCDLLAPVAMINLAVGRIGCLLNGCCYGKFAPGLWWGIVYPPSHPALGLAQMPVHPTPIYEVLAVLIIFGVLVLMSRHKKFQGQVFWAMVLLYAVARFILEFFRGDPRGTAPLIGLSTSQGIAVVAGATAIIMLAWLYRKSVKGSRAS
ncbi:MAG TPA: prolipoprotein diacylglyceryl transferase [bacterium]|nr:prolipoprotein diacylglyceryl transferase [bacterium]